MNRARGRIRAGDRDGLRLAHERVLNLTDLTVDVRAERALRREPALWRDLIARLYIAPRPDAGEHDAAFRALLMLSPEGYGQIPYPAEGRIEARPGAGSPR